MYHAWYMTHPGGENIHPRTSSLLRRGSASLFAIRSTFLTRDLSCAGKCSHSEVGITTNLASSQHITATLIKDSCSRLGSTTFFLTPRRFVKSGMCVRSGMLTQAPWR